MFTFPFFSLNLFVWALLRRALSSHPLSRRPTTLLGRAVIDYLSLLYKYEIVCLSVCLFAFFSANTKPIGIPFGTKFVFYPWEGSKTILLKKKVSF